MKTDVFPHKRQICECSQSRYSEEPNSGNNSNVHQMVNGLDEEKVVYVYNGIIFRYELLMYTTTIFENESPNMKTPYCRAVLMCNVQVTYKTQNQTNGGN